MLKARYDQVSKETLFSQKFNISTKSAAKSTYYERIFPFTKNEDSDIRRRTKMSKEKCIHIWYALKNLGASEDLYTSVRM